MTHLPSLCSAIRGLASFGAGSDMAMAVPGITVRPNNI